MTQESYNHHDNRTGFRRPPREDDEYHVPDPVDNRKKHTIRMKLSKDGGPIQHKQMDVKTLHGAEHAKNFAHDHARKQGWTVHEEVATNNVGDGNIAGTQGDAGKKAVMTKEPLKRKKITDFREFVELNEKGLWDNIHAKRKRIKNGSGERMRKPGEKGAPTAADFKAANEEVSLGEGHDDYKAIAKELVKRHGKNVTKDHIKGIESERDSRSSLDHDEIMSHVKKLTEAAVDSKGHKSSTGGLTQKGRDYYNNKTGGNLQAPVTTKPSKLDPDSKAAKRRKSFCARMGGMKKRLTSAKTANDPDSRINKALRKWNC